MIEPIIELKLPELPAQLPATVIDSHTHLLSTTQHSGLAMADSLRLAATVGVNRVVDIGYDVASSEAATRNAASEPNVVAAVAIHPNDAAKIVADYGRNALDDALTKIESLLTCPGVRAVGETGLDYFRTLDESGRAVQAESFLTHIEWALRHDLTLVIHDREAHADILRILDLGFLPNRIIMHCFSGDADFAQECLARDAWLSFPGVVTFSSAGSLREALQVVPLDKLLVETDAPYLTPVPMRGKPNAPYLLPHTVRFIATELGIAVAELCDILTANTIAAYGGQWGSNE